MQVPRRNSNLDAPRFACGLTSISCLFGVLVPDAARDRAALASLLRARAPRAPGEMHSFWQRLNALFFFALSVLGFLSFSAAGTTYWHESNPQISLTAHKVVLRKIHGAGHDQAILTLGIDADLRSVFNWNVKQLFVYITAEYETAANVLNQVIVWDSIISSPDNAHIKSSAVANKYSLTDQGYGLRGNNVTLVLNWNTVPSTGLLTLHHGAHCARGKCHAPRTLSPPPTPPARDDPPNGPLKLSLCPP